MGIKDYLKHLEQKELTFKSTINYENLYIDCNYMIHYLIYKCNNDFELCTKTFDYFKYIFSIIKVSKTIIYVFNKSLNGWVR